MPFPSVITAGNNNGGGADGGQLLGLWNADTNTPTLSSGDTELPGNRYKVSVAGTVDIGEGAITYNVGDFIVAAVAGGWLIEDNTHTGGGGDVTQAGNNSFTGLNTFTQVLEITTAGNLPYTIGGEQIEASDLFSYSSIEYANGTKLGKYVVVGIPSIKANADVVAVDPTETEVIYYVNGIVDEPQLTGMINFSNAWVYTYDKALDAGNLFLNQVGFSPIYTSSNATDGDSSAALNAAGTNGTASISHDNGDYVSVSDTGIDQNSDLINFKANDGTNRFSLALGVGASINGALNQPFNIQATGTGQNSIQAEANVNIQSISNDVAIKFPVGKNALLDRDSTVDLGACTKAQMERADIVTFSGGSFFVTAAHRGKVLVHTGGGPTTLFIPTGLVAMNFVVMTETADNVTISGSGTTIRNKGGLFTTDGQYSMVTVIARSSTLYNISGDLA